MFFTARFARDAGFAEEKYVFFSAERAEKKKIYALVIDQNHSGVNKGNYSKKNYIAVRLVFFVFLPLKGKQEKSKLSVLCGFAVNNSI
ncbi:MAG: hypothetical protein ISS66_07990 [Desulfobacteraceae bacterium]|nr:hypothetical protein [Desulfobacteraceae bacterium]